MLSSHTPSIPVRQCSSATRAPKAAVCRRCSIPPRRSRRTRRSPEASRSSQTAVSPVPQRGRSRPRQPGGCGRRADRTCGGGRPHPYRHPRAQPVHHRSKRRRENAGTDGGDPRCTPCCVESPSAPIYKRCAPVLHPARRIAHARRLYGIVHCPSIGRTSPFRMRERESCDNG